MGILTDLVFLHYHLAEPIENRVSDPLNVTDKEKQKLKILIINFKKDVFVPKTLKSLKTNAYSANHMIMRNQTDSGSYP